MSTAQPPDSQLRPRPMATPANHGNNDGTPLTVNMLTVGDALAQLADNLPPNVTPQAAQVTRKRLASLRRSTLAPKRLSALTVAELASWLQQRSCHDRPAVAGLECSLLLRALGLSPSRRDVITCGVADSSGRTPTTERSRGIVDKPTFDKLLDATERSTRAPELRAVFLLGRDAGMRVREAQMLQWHQVDLEAGHVNIPGERHRPTRRLPLSERTVCALVALPRQDSERVFASFGTTRALHMAIRRACEAAGVETLTLGDLRRFSAESQTR